MYLIPKLLHTLRYLKNKSYLSSFWISIVKKYGMRRLSNEHIEWIIKAKVNGKLTNKEIADVQGISISRVQQLYREYKSTGVIHVQKKVGRHKMPVPESVKNEKPLYFCTLYKAVALCKLIYPAQLQSLYW